MKAEQATGWIEWRTPLSPVQGEVVVRWERGFVTVRRLSGDDVTDEWMSLLQLIERWPLVMHDSSREWSSFEEMIDAGPGRMALFLQSVAALDEVDRSGDYRPERLIAEPGDEKILF